MAIFSPFSDSCPEAPSAEPLPAAKQNQIKSSKSKQFSLRFLGFLWPIRDFSMGYSDSK
jgi:hypothetical protein